MQTNITITKWITLSFFYLTFYLWGVMTMLRFVAYIPLNKAHQNWQSYIALFNQNTHTYYDKISHNNLTPMRGIAALLTFFFSISTLCFAQS